MAAGSDDVYIYAGVTRWGGGGSQSAKPNTLGGVFRLRLGDTAWEHMMSGFPEVIHVHCIVIHPQDKDICFAGTHDGVFRSTDRGVTWKRMRLEPRDRQIWSIAIDPHDVRRMFAGASPVGIYRSDDGGESWIENPTAAIPDHLAMGNFKNRVMRIAISPSDKRVLCACMEVNGAMASDDSAVTWSDRSANLLELARRPHLKSKILTESEQEGMLDVHAITILSTGSNAAFIANRMGIFRSDDNCRTWADLEVGRQSQFTYAREIRASQCEPGVLYASLNVSSRGPTGSVVRSDDQGANWKRIDHDVEIKSTVTSIAQHPKRPEIIFFSARNGQAFGTRDGGRTWEAYPLPKGCEGAYAITCA